MRQTQYDTLILCYGFCRVQADFNSKLNARVHLGLFSTIFIKSGQHKQTSARWILITSRSESFSAGVSFPNEAK